jgi:CRP-like cAMP-binding protein
MLDLDASDPLPQVSLLAGLSPELCQQVQASLTPRDYPAGRTILMEDAWGNAVYLILSGWVKVRRSTAAKTTTLAILGPGSFFGEMAVLDEAPRSTDVVAITPVNVGVIPAQRFTELLLQQPHLSYRFAQQMAHRLRQTNQRMRLSQQTPGVRLVYTLVQLAEDHGQKTAQGMQLFQVPAEDLADLAGISPQEVSKVIEKLTSQGVIILETQNKTMLLTQYEKMVEASHLV